MSIFFRTFSKILGFLTSVSVFIIILFFIINFIKSTNKISDFIYFEGDPKSSNKIALLNLNGPIISEPTNLFNFEILKQMNIIYPSLVKNYLDNLIEEEIVGLIVSINSAGGSVSASNRVYKLFNNFTTSNNIKLYFHSSEMLASGAYWVALSANKIFANYGSLIGSIGVKGPDWIYYNNPTALSSGLLGNSVESQNGIKMFSSTAGRSKDILNPFRAPNTKEKAHLKKMVNNIYDDFVNLVSMNRKIEAEIIVNDIGAMIYESKEAKSNYLINDIKDINEVIETIIYDLSLEDYQIIKNNTKNTISLNNLNISYKFNNEKFYQNYLDYFNNIVCYNIKYELSSFAINNFNTSC